MVGTHTNVPGVTDRSDGFGTTYVATLRTPTTCHIDMYHRTNKEMALRTRVERYSIPVYAGHISGSPLLHGSKYVLYDSMTCVNATTYGFSGDGSRLAIEIFARFLTFVSLSGKNEVSRDKPSSAYPSLGCIRQIALSI